MHDTATDDVFRALADPTRRAVFEQVMRGGETTVGDLTRRFHVSQPAISQHVAALERCGLVSKRRAGKFVHYQANPKGLAPLIDWIEHYQAFWLDRMTKLKALLDTLEDD